MRRSHSSRQRPIRDGDLDAVSRRLDELAGRLDALSIPDGLEYRGRVSPDLTDAAMDSAGLDAILDTLDVIDQWIESSRQRHMGRREDELQRAVGEIVRRQAALDRGLGAEPDQAPGAISPQPGDAPDPQLEELARSIDGLRAELAAHAQTHRDETQGAVLAGIESQLEQFAGHGGSVDQLRTELGALRAAQETSGSSLQSLEEAYRLLVERLDRLNNRPSADARLLTSIGDALTLIRNKLNVLPASDVMISVNGRLAQLTERLEAASAQPVRPDLSQLEKQIDRLAEVLGTRGGTVMVPGLDSSLRHLSERLDTVWKIVNGGGFSGDPVEPKTAGPESEALEKLAAQIGELQSQLLEKPEPPDKTAEIHRRLDEILDRLEQPPAGHAVVDALNSIDERIARLAESGGADRKTAPSAAAVELLEQRLSELTGRLDQLARSPAGGVDDLRAEMTRLHRDAQSSSERIHADQQSLHRTLQVIVAHLETGRGKSSESASEAGCELPPHNYREDHRPRPPGSDEGDVPDRYRYHDADPQARRADFIAAARRAARAASEQIPEPATSRKAQRLSWFRRKLAGGGPASSAPRPEKLAGTGFGRSRRVERNPSASETEAPQADDRPLDEIDDEPAASRRGSLLLAGAIILSAAGGVALSSYSDDAGPPLDISAAGRSDTTGSGVDEVGEQHGRAPKAARLATAKPPMVSIDIPKLPARPAAWASPTETGAIPDIATRPLPAAIGPQALRDAAADGDAHAQFEIASRFTVDTYVGADFETAAAWYRRAAARNLAPAQFRLGSLYERGKGVDQDLEQARHWYTRAAELGNAKAMHNLAVLHAEGKIGPPDYAQAAKWFERAAEHGVRDSQYNLAILRARGLGAPRDPALSYKWFAIAAELGDREAAAKRDAIAGTLSRQALARARAEAAAWSPTPVEDKANVVPRSGWDAGADKSAGLSGPLRPGA